MPRNMPRWESSSERDNAADTGVVAQILAAVTQLSQEFSEFRETAAKATDLHTLVPREIYETQRTADQQMATLTATRLTNIEASINALKDDFHKFQIADAQKLAQAQITTQQQFGQAQALTYQQVGAAQSTMAGMINKVKDLLLGAFITATFSLLLFVATHSFK